MKKLTALLAVLVLTGAQSLRADLLGIGDITPDGSLEVVGQSANNESDANDTGVDHRGGANTRIRLGLNAEVVDGVNGRVEFTRIGRQYGTAPTTVAGEEATIQVQSAYVDIEDLFKLDGFRLGRQYGGRKGDLLLYYAPYNDDNLTCQALDGLTVSKKFNKIDVMAGTGKTFESAALSATDTGDTNVSWIVAGSDQIIPTMKVPLELGFYTGTRNNTTAINDNINLTIIDLRASTLLLDDTVNLGLEYAMNGGQVNAAAVPGGPAAANVDFKGTALLLNASYNNKENVWTAHLRYANASGHDATSTSGDDDAFHDFSTVGWAVSDYRIGEILSNSNALSVGNGQMVGLDTGIGGTGITVINIGGDYILPWMDKKVTAVADYFMSNANEVGAGADDGIGTEIDLSLNYKHSDNVGAAIGYATFSPDKGYLTGFAAGGNPTDDAITKMFAKLNIKWGGERAY